ncbi:RelA/SpoT domain-containing protein [Pelagibacterium sp. H642]|uniref:RelA/SpoT domain-containing protein n=1 Tax=Pelagibacterium sp. H642 TaxID=1881069 RepID=UPI0028168948|nr:RelA/SpoT domain-containing protein [Pelagibacterium sp. H642]WMT90106.1 RelA/SpoT domain-containing protein [Pelagibacterium sp. H642]
MAFTQPPESRSRVRNAGRAVAEQRATPEDYELIDQWRAAHSYVLNTFKVWFRRRIEHAPINAEFAQRLKRRNTVLDKLQRMKPDGTPLIRDVTTMQDFAGCRLIFDSIDDLNAFRGDLLSPRSMENVNHKLKHSDLDKYNYIEHPKTTGYRGIHDVFLHYPRPHRRGNQTSAPWQGLMVEVQYRTRAQHAWATALEISDIMDRQRTKFGHGDDDRGIFFSMASEIIARRHEGMQRAFVNLTDKELENEFLVLERELGILQRLGAMRQFDEFDKLRKHNVLNIFANDGGAYSLEVEVFSNSEDAVARASQLEASGESINAVYVTGEPQQLRSAYRNYFNDPVDFVNLLKG